MGIARRNDKDRIQFFRVQEFQSVLIDSRTRKDALRHLLSFLPLIRNRNYGNILRRRNLLQTEQMGISHAAYPDKTDLHGRLPDFWYKNKTVMPYAFLRFSYEFCRVLRCPMYKYGTALLSIL